VTVSDGTLTANDTLVLTVNPAGGGGLVAAYGFNEGSGTTVADVSGQGNGGTVSGATWTTSGRFGQALTFNGSSSRVVITDSASLDLTTGMTLEAWVFPTLGGGWRDLIYKEPNDIYFLMSSSDTGSPALGGTFASTEVKGTTSLPLNAWTHLAGTYDGSNMRLYTNGVQAASRAQSGLIQTSTGSLSIGGDALYGQHFAGRIDEVRIYNRALTATEIQTDMNTAVGSLPFQGAAVASFSATVRILDVVRGGPVSLRIDGVPGRSYAIETSTDLSSWTRVGIVSDPKGISSFTDTRPATNQALYYRVLENAAP
jgi:hypothetical protein